MARYIYMFNHGIMGYLKPIINLVNEKSERFQMADKGSTC